MRFDISTDVEHTECPLNYRGWESMQAFEDYYEAEDLRNEIRNVFAILRSRNNWVLMR